MMTVQEMSRHTGVSVRTLHHYDAIGLLKPARVTEAGYRLYDAESVRRLQSILLLRELDFPLREIGKILENTAGCAAEALEEQIGLLEEKRRRLDRIIAQARRMQKEGMDMMDLGAFDKTEFEKQQAEAREKWGRTAAWAEYEKKPRGNMQAAGDVLMEHFRRIGELRHLSPESAEIQEQISLLQSCITENFYTCTPEILRGLGQMYTADERFRRNIDSAGGEGTADLVSRAIDIFCAEKE